MDRGVQYFDLVKQYIVDNLGFKPEEVGIISAKMPAIKGVKPKYAKQHIQDLFLGRVFNQSTLSYDEIPDEKRIKILIGSSSIQEGINLQKYTSCLFNLWLEWNPTAYMQLIGRLWRQGNVFEYVRIANWLLEDSIDSFMFQKNEEKTSRINALFNRDGKTNFLNTDEFNPAELKHQIIKDPRVIAQMIVDEEMERASEDISEIDSDILILNEALLALNYTIDKQKDIEKIVAQFRPSYAFTSLKATVSVYEDIIKTQTDDDGNSLQDPVFQRKYNIPSYGLDKPSWWDGFKKSFNYIERQKSKFLEPKKIDATPEAISAKILEYESRKADIVELKKASSAEENIEIIIKNIIRQRAANPIIAKDVFEIASEFERLNYLLSKRLDNPKIKETIDKPIIILELVFKRGNITF
jgi:hypothetical protein